jgi:DNA-binding NarL/FixJ family response regulator
MSKSAGLRLLKMILPTVSCIVVADQVLVLEGRALAVRHSPEVSRSNSDLGNPPGEQSLGQAAGAQAFLLSALGGDHNLVNVLQGILAAAPHAVPLSLPADADSAFIPDLPNRSGGYRHATRLAPVVSPRQVEVLRNMAEGVTEREIARRLGISERTVQLHVANICRALGVRSHFQLGLVAARHSLI